MHLFISQRTFLAESFDAVADMDLEVASRGRLTASTVSLEVSTQMVVRGDKAEMLPNFIFLPLHSSWRSLALTVGALICI